MGFLKKLNPGVLLDVVRAQYPGLGRVIDKTVAGVKTVGGVIKGTTTPELAEQRLALEQDRLGVGPTSALGKPWVLIGALAVVAFLIVKA